MYVFANKGFPFDWEYVPAVQRYYRPVFELASWSMAHSRCRQFGSRSRLADVNNAVENEALKMFMDSFDRKSMYSNQNKIIMLIFPRGDKPDKGREAKVEGEVWVGGRTDGVHAVYNATYYGRVQWQSIHFVSERLRLDRVSFARYL